MIELVMALAVSFFSTLFIAPKIIRYFKLVGITTRDVHKKEMPLIPSSAGVAVVIGLVAGLLFYIFLRTFVYNNRTGLELFAAITTVLIAMFGGFLDDLNIRQKRVGGYVEGKSGLRAGQKLLLTLPVAIPLMVIIAGNSTMNIPLIGKVNFGIFYPLFIVPIGVICTANMVNMLGGFNGLEAGMGLVYTSSLGVFALIHGEVIATVLLLTTSAALIAILKYNWTPAKILPGDSMTYVLGAVVATSAILGNMEKVAIITMIPFIAQGILKFYARFKLGRFPSDMGVLQKDGTIKPKYDGKIYSWTHLVMNMGNFSEKKIVLVMMGIQLIFSLIPFLNIL